MTKDKVLVFTAITGNGIPVQLQAENALAELEGEWQVVSATTAVNHVLVGTTDGVKPAYWSEYVLTMTIRPVSS
jgi:hypothetical protein